MTGKQLKVLYRILISFVLVVAFAFVPAEGWLKFLLYLIPYLIIGYDILRKAVLGVIHGEVFDENFLMAVATVGAMLLGEYQEGAAVMLFYQIGELFQSVAVGKSRRNISALMDIRPDYANLEREDGSLEQVDPDEVPIGSVIVVKPGEKVPIDGVVCEGSSVLNTSALTGESVPRDVTVGDDIISGCINESGLLKIRTTREFGESTVSKILDLVENSSMKKAKAENFITRFAHYYTPAVCFGALALALIPPVLHLLTHQPAGWTDWITRALTFLVISCPCALVISIPLSFFGGIGGASSCGILVKGSNYLEMLSKTRYMVFDKTGTLTKGVFQVTGIYPDRTWEEKVPASAELLLEYAAYAESYSDHPISKSLRAAYGKPIDQTAVENAQEIGGHGVIAVVKDRAGMEGAGETNGCGASNPGKEHQVAAGNLKLMKKLGLSVAEAGQAGTVVYVAVDGIYAGYLLISDVLKEQSAEALSELKRLGVKRTVMLTGDGKRAAEAVAAQLHVDEVRSELLPGDKVEQVEQLLAAKGKKEVLAFVGDGINDAPVLSRADIGIAMGALGSDAAIEAADIVLMDDNPAKIAQAIRISRKCLRIVYENIAFALSVKAVCLVLGATGDATMWLAIFADVGVMVIAVLNAIRCLKVDGRN